MVRANNAALAAAALASLTLFDIAIADAAPKKPAPLMMVDPWTGFYIGGYVGGAWANDETPGQEFSTSGLDAGVLAGYNFHITPSVVFGLEASFGFLRLDNKSTFDDFTARSDWNGEATARLGFLVGQPGWNSGFLLYGKSGLAFQHQQIIFSDGSDSATRVGWAIGGGIETTFIQYAGWTARAEYTREFYATSSFFDSNFPVETHVDRFRVGFTHTIVTR